MCGEYLSQALRMVRCSGLSPHVRGTRTGITQNRSIVGLSPHVRGTRRIRNLLSPEQRSIPACAGNTAVQNKGETDETVYPRMCGEHTEYATIQAGIAGLSPHVRGTQVLKDPRFRQARSIPACAGNTIFSPI